MVSKKNRYQQLIEKIFSEGYSDGITEIPFQRVDLETTASELGIDLPKNLGDVIYAMRYRTPLPNSVRKTQPKGKEWIIEGAGRAQYVFKLVPINRIEPNIDLITIKLPDATPEIV